MVVTTLRQLPLVKRKKVREVMEDIRDKTKEQKEKVYDLFVKPYDDRIKAINDFLKNEIPMERCMNILKTRSIRIKEVLSNKKVKKGVKK